MHAIRAVQMATLATRRTRFRYLLTLHRYVTLLRTESHKKLTTVLFLGAFLLGVFFSLIRFRYEYGAAQWRLWEGSVAVIGFVAIVAFGVASLKILWPVVIDPKGLMIPNGILRNFGTVEKFRDWLHSSDEHAFANALITEILAISEAQKRRSASLKGCIVCVGVIFVCCMLIAGTIVGEKITAKPNEPKPTVSSPSFPFP